MSEFRRGQMMTVAENSVCYCGDGSPHVHAGTKVFDGEKWVDMETPEGTALLAILKSEFCS